MEGAVGKLHQTLLRIRSGIRRMQGASQWVVSLIHDDELRDLRHDLEFPDAFHVLCRMLLGFGFRPMCSLSVDGLNTCCQGHCASSGGSEELPELLFLRLIKHVFLQATFANWTARLFGLDRTLPAESRYERVQPLGPNGSDFVISQSFDFQRAGKLIRSRDCVGVFPEEGIHDIDNPGDRLGDVVEICICVILPY